MELTRDQREGLREALEPTLGPGVELTQVQPISAGASRLSFAVDARAAGRTHELVLQRERTRGGSLCPVGTEARLLQAASSAGVPVPELVTFDGDGALLDGSYIVTRRVAGETLGGRIRRNEHLAGARAVFVEQCGRVLAELHRVPVGDVAPLDAPDPLDVVTGWLDSVPVRRPVFELAVRQLRATRPGSRPNGLVHGDFRLGNLVIDSQGIRAVLDWELAHLGNPVEDLGWLCAVPWRFGGRPPVGGLGEIEDLLASYRSHGGADIGVAEVRWWQTFASLRWGVFCLVQAGVHLSGRYRSVELAVVGRMAAEMEYDLLCRST